jgi:lipopolysaccharide transport system permease protein
MIHFFLGLPILALFLIYYRAPLSVGELLWFPVVVFVQFLLTTGLALVLAALTVHFRDIRDILSNVLTFWFFATPIIYQMKDAPKDQRWILNLNPFTHLAISYQEILFYPGAFGHWKWLLLTGAGSLVLFFAGYFLFDRLRDSFAEEV